MAQMRPKTVQLTRCLVYVYQRFPFALPFPAPLALPLPLAEYFKGGTFASAELIALSAICKASAHGTPSDHAAAAAL